MSLGVIYCTREISCGSTKPSHGNELNPTGGTTLATQYGNNFTTLRLIEDQKAEIINNNKLTHMLARNNPLSR